MTFDAILERIKRITDQYGTVQHDTLLALNEELGEYCRAIRQERFGHRKECNEPAKIEAIDLMLVSFEAYLDAGGTVEELPELASGKLDKWEKKLNERQL
jgi:hypothetical protein